MKKNEGNLDRGIRISLGIGLAIAAITTQFLWLFIFAIPIFLTGVVGVCGIYSLLGINTCSIKIGQNKE